MGYSLNNQTNIFNAMTKFKPFEIECTFVEQMNNEGFSINASTTGVDIIKDGKVVFNGSFQDCQEWLKTLVSLRQRFFAQCKTVVKCATIWSILGVIFWGIAFNSDFLPAKIALMVVGSVCSLTLLANIVWYFSNKKKLWIDTK